MIELGAWRSLRTADGRTAQDIAGERGHRYLLERLAPHGQHVEPQMRAALDRHLAAVVQSVVRPALSGNLRCPPTEVLAELPQRKVWLPVPGMYGGFTISLLRSYRYVESWRRVVQGSGKAHAITAEGSTLVEQGFV